MDALSALFRTHVEFVITDGYDANRSLVTRMIKSLHPVPMPLLAQECIEVAKLAGVSATCMAQIKADAAHLARSTNARDLRKLA